MKSKRHSKIIDLVSNNDIETQEDLANMLKELGFEVTQATISRDIRELKLTKVTASTGKQKYIVLSSINNSVTSEKFVSVFREAVLYIDHAQNIVVIKTLEGMAMGIGAAIDAMSNSEVMGCIAGDDTLFCLVKTEDCAVMLSERLKLLINNFEKS